MGFVLFLLTNALFLYQPAAFWPELASYSLYQYAILTCLAVALPSILTNLLDIEKLHRQPITVCVLGLLVAAVLSNLLFQFNLTDAKESGIAFAKIVVYYLVFISLVNTPERLRGFLTWLALLVAGLAVLTLLQYYHVIEIESLKVLEQKDIKESGEVDVLLRLRGSGSAWASSPKRKSTSSTIPSCKASPNWGCSVVCCSWARFLPASCRSTGWAARAWPSPTPGWRGCGLIFWPWFAPMPPAW